MRIHINVLCHTKRHVFKFDNVRLDEYAESNVYLPKQEFRGLSGPRMSDMFFIQKCLKHISYLKLCHYISLLV